MLEAWNICDAEHILAWCEPLTHGRIQVQAEGSETLFRHINAGADQVPTEGDGGALDVIRETDLRPQKTESFFSEVLRWAS